MQYLDFDVVCVGGGGAGVAAATSAAAEGARVALISKLPVGFGTTKIAYGITSRPGLDPQDTHEQFLKDMLRAGDGLNDAGLARVMAGEASSASEQLEAFGHLFERDPEGRLSASVGRRPGGHSLVRALTCRGQGQSMSQALRAAAARYPVDVLENTAVVQLVLDAGRVAGLIALRLRDGEVLAVRAGAVVLATGGAEWLYYPHTDGMKGATGDGYALALQAGAELVDMEQVQFLPFAVTHPGSMVGLFLGEPALAGPRGRLLNGEGREVLGAGLNRLTRAQVTKAMAVEIAAGRVTQHGGLGLDLAPNLDCEDGRQNWETMKKIGYLDTARAAYGERAYRLEQPWDVCPTAHFNMGGVRVDEWGRTPVPGIFAAGEVAGGVHGGNRLGSVALAELFVFGRRAGRTAASECDATSVCRDILAGAATELEATRGKSGSLPPIKLSRRLQSVMWEKAGIARTEEGLSSALSEVATLRDMAQDIKVSPSLVHNMDRLEALELQFMLTTAEAVVRSALLRRETRGAHLRLDFPDQIDATPTYNVVVRGTSPLSALQMPAVSG